MRGFFSIVVTLFFNFILTHLAISRKGVAGNGFLIRCDRRRAHPTRKFWNVSALVIYHVQGHNVDYFSEYVPALSSLITLARVKLPSAFRSHELAPIQHLKPPACAKGLSREAPREVD